MILNIKSYLLKIDIYSILVLLIFLAAPLRFYVSTSIILEIVTFGLVVWGFAKHKFTKKFGLQLQANLLYTSLFIL